MSKVIAVPTLLLSRPLTMRYLETPNVPLPKPPTEKRRPPDPDVRNVQARLIELGYLLKGDDDGRAGPTTSEGILASQKYERLTRTGVLNGATREALVSATRPVALTHGGAGKRAEILLGRNDGRTGRGMRSLGLHRPATTVLVSVLPSL